MAPLDRQLPAEHEIRHLPALPPTPPTKRLRLRHDSPSIGVLITQSGLSNKGLAMRGIGPADRFFGQLVSIWQLLINQPSAIIQS